MLATAPNHASCLQRRDYSSATIENDCRIKIGCAAGLQPRLYPSNLDGVICLQLVLLAIFLGLCCLGVRNSLGARRLSQFQDKELCFDSHEQELNCCHHLLQMDRLGRYQSVVGVKHDLQLGQMTLFVEERIPQDRVHRLCYSFRRRFLPQHKYWLSLTARQLISVDFRNAFCT